LRREVIIHFADIGGIGKASLYKLSFHNCNW
jgi:hypothetical protein